MNKLLFLFVYCWISCVHSDEGTQTSPFSTRVTYQAVTSFDGDTYGDFAGDYVITLSDGSAWKVHPKDREKFELWRLDDTIQVNARNTFYWFKREHKFELHNLTCDDKARVMLLGYPEEPLVIVDSEVFVMRWMTVGNTYQIAQGIYYTHYDNVPVYGKRLFLNDGSVWEISKGFSNFMVGDSVYIGSNDPKDPEYSFLISGRERAAVWIWTRKVILL